MHGLLPSQCSTCTPGPAIGWCDEVLQAAQGVSHTTPPHSMPRRLGVILVIIFTTPFPQLQGRKVHKACSQGQDLGILLPASCVYSVMPATTGMGHPSTIMRQAPATAAIRFGPRAAPLMLSSRSDVLHAASSASAPP